MLPEKSSNEFWCPLGDPATAREHPSAEDSIAAADKAALSRLANGDWLSDAEMARLQALGLAERVFGQAVLTRLGRSTLGIASSR